MKKQLLPSAFDASAPPGTEGVPPSDTKEVTLNPTTRKAMDQLEQGKGKRFDNADQLFEDLGV